MPIQSTVFATAPVCTPSSPVKVLAPARVSVPAPTFVRLPTPESTPA